MATDIGDPGTEAELLDYVNVPPTIGMALSSDKSLLGPLSSTLGLEDLHDILEVISVDAHNQRVLAKARRREND